MNVLTRFKIATRLAIGFGLVLLLASAMLLMGLYRMSQLRTSTDYIFNSKVASLNAAEDMRAQGRSLSLILRKLTAPKDSAERESEVKNLAVVLDSYAKSEARLKTYLDEPESQKTFQTASKIKQTILSLIEKIKGNVVGGNYFDAADVLQTEFNQPYEQWMHALGELATEQNKAMLTTYEHSQTDYHNAVTAMLIVGVLIIGFGSYAAWVISRSISTALSSAARHADEIASGNLTAHIQVSGEDEISALLASLKQMQGNLVQTVQQIKLGTSTIAMASREVASGNADLSNRTEAQASSLEETASSMEELTSTVKQNADNARHANQLVVSASDVALKGGNVVGQVVSTMGSIKESSRKIVDIISVIDGIAFQTNILALNAAVEAARAGEQGRGFAVVATEVRNLAQRSATAAKEIKDLIGGSVQQIEQGGLLVDEAGQTMREIMTSVQQVADIMSEIAAASQEQSAGIEQVNRAITQMDAMTQQNAALVEQASAAAVSMEDQAAALAESVNVFTLHPTETVLTHSATLGLHKASQPMSASHSAGMRRLSA